MLQRNSIAVKKLFENGNVFPEKFFFKGFDIFLSQFFFQFAVFDVLFSNLSVVVKRWEVS